MNQAMLYDDYIKLRDAKVGDTVHLSTGDIVKTADLKEKPRERRIYGRRHGKRPSLSQYDSNMK